MLPFTNGNSIPRSYGMMEWILEHLFEGRGTVPAAIGVDAVIDPTLSSPALPCGETGREPGSKTD